MHPIVLYNHAIGKILRTLDKMPKTFNKKTLIPYNPDWISSQKSNLAQTMRLIVLYNHAKNWEDP